MPRACLCLRRCFHIATQRIAEDHYVKEHPEYGKVWMDAKRNKDLGSMKVFFEKGHNGRVCLRQQPRNKAKKRVCAPAAAPAAASDAASAAGFFSLNIRSL